MGLEFCTSAEISEKKNQSKLTESKSKRKRSYSNVPAGVVIQKLTHGKVNDGVKRMLNAHRAMV